jgi:Site-specific DNA methylase
MCILRNQLRDFGYDLHEEVLQAADWNALEHRERMCMVAVTKGLSFDFSSLARPERCERRIGDILDPVSEDALCWSRMEGLKAKQERDKAEGKGFAMQIVTPFDTKCPTITKGYAKVRSTDPKLQHPSDPDLLRQFTPAEHARIKGIPERLVSGLSLTLAHELLGQSVCYEPFRAVGRLVGQALMARGNVISYSKGTSTYRVAIAG